MAAKKTAFKTKPAAKKAKAKAKAKPATPGKAKAKPASKTKVKAKPVAKAKRAPSKAAPTAKLKGKPAPKGKPAGKAKPSKSWLARAALQAAAMKKVIADVLTPVEKSGSDVVDAYMRDIDHPFKAEIEAVRAIILGASPKISERIKWNAPSFYYKEDLGAFNPRASEFAHLILLFPGGAGLPAKSSLLEGKQKDRREAKFYSMADVQTKKPALTKLVKDWVKLREA